MSGNLQGENVWSGERERENNGFDLMRKNYYFFVSVSMYVHDSYFLFSNWLEQNFMYEIYVCISLICRVILRTKI